ncbi:MAG: PfkB family carbohydrate kinase [Ferruginibacter sp.]
MYNICCIGHITLDRIITPEADVFMPGGTAWYFSKALSNLDVKYVLITSLAATEKNFVQQLADEGIKVKLFTSTHTLYFENIYGADTNQRTQRVLQVADIFTTEQVSDITAGIFHLGTLMANDIPLEVIKELAKKGKVAADIQGYLRKLNGQQVEATDWKDKMEALPYIDILKVNEQEMEALTGTSDVKQAARQLNDWGAKEIVITLGSMGSVIYYEKQFYTIPAYVPAAVVDATGCGDTYMAGYLYCRAKGQVPGTAGKFAAAMATLKIGKQGPFNGTEEDVFNIIKQEA